MSDHIDYYFTTASPFTYLGHNALVEVANRHGKKLNLKPVNLGEVFTNSGAVMPNLRPPVRQRYRLIELQRIAEYRGLKIHHQPANFPTNPAPADHCVCALVAQGKDACGFLFRVGEALWTHDRQIADEAVLGELLVAEGFDADAVLKASQQEAVEKMRHENTEAAIGADAVGAPAFVYNGEVFWGQDRISYLDSMIESGRPSYKPA